MYQPEGDADYEDEVLKFVYEHGSFAELQRAIVRYVGLTRHITTIAKASIVFAVGALESAVAGIERSRLKRHIGAVSGANENEFSLEDLVRLGDIDAVIDEAIEKRVERLCYGNLDEWSKWYERAFKVQLDSLAHDWNAVREIVQRRHVIAHNGGRVSRLYLERSGCHPETELGSNLPLSPSYVYGALDEVGVLGVRMIAHAWARLGDESDLLDILRRVGYEALVAKRWEVTIAVADETCARGEEGSPDVLVARVNRWLARIGKGEDVASEVEAWNVEALNVRSQIAKAALLDDFNTLASTIPSALDSGDIHRDELLTWPLFQNLRAEPVFISLLERASGGSSASPDEGS